MFDVGVEPDGYKWTINTFGLQNARILLFWTAKIVGAEKLTALKIGLDYTSLCQKGT